MGGVRTVSIDRLRDRLREILGADTLLFRRFDLALRLRDADRLAATIDCLALYPQIVRHEVEDALLAWLLGGPQAPGAAISSPTLRIR